MEIKKALYKRCQEQVLQKLESATSVMDNASQSMLNDTKSSAGDKFETSRAMLQAEQERMKAVIIKTKALEHQLKHLDLSSSEKVKAGSLVLTSDLNYFISIGLGKLIFEEEKYYAISGVAPIGKLLLGKSAGEHVAFNGKTFTIEKVI